MGYKWAKTKEAHSHANSEQPKLTENVPASEKVTTVTTVGWSGAHNQRYEENNPST